MIKFIVKFFILSACFLLIGCSKHVRDFREFKTGKYTIVKSIGVVVAELNDEEISICSGALVKGRYILTSSHCIADISENIISADKITYRPLDDSGRIYYVDQNILPDKKLTSNSFKNYKTKFDISKEEIALDWVFLKLKSNLSSKYDSFQIAPYKDLPFELSSYGFGKSLFANIAGHLKNDKVNFIKDCNVESYLKDTRILFHKCKTFKGNSGGPVWIYLEGKPTIVGINSSVFEGFFGGDVSAATSSVNFYDKYLTLP